MKVNDITLTRRFLIGHTPGNEKARKTETEVKGWDTDYSEGL